MKHIIGFLVGVFLLLEGMALATAEETSAKAYCADANYGRLDFWLGTWKVSWGKGDKRGEGINRIRKIYEGCVVEERFDGGVMGGHHFRGGSYSIFDKHSGQWRQTWVDNQGGYFDFYGKDLGKEFVFETRPETSRAGPLRRMLFTDITADSLTWRWQKSEDGGRNWTDLWVIYYERLSETSN
ncbi:hypothetical protein [Luteithermobacter gelatinilyticus]|uniref:hypothetical protein n=1 Tax=Luteithermobacter gelatinilyticus TaxID=2582913 RepID=UPI001106CC41|nr:hypothetical protein [Luteithermobacter gelatinilyticus]|tara:strand:- start:4282 stop:4830 length:549 start_codon:yes stop_codon:yes gene_type:complete